MYRELAPINQNVWKQIDERAKEVFLSTLIARKAVHVSDEKGTDYVAYNHGKLGKVSYEDDVAYAGYQVTPLVETRIEFTLNRWELDNAVRGNKNIDFSNLEAAVKKIALFEEKAIWKGNPEAGIRGLTEVSSEVISFGTDEQSIKRSITEGILKLKGAFVNEGMDLFVSRSIYTTIMSLPSQTPLKAAIEEMIGGKVYSSEILEGALLVPHDNENLDLVLGEDFSLGYQEHTKKEVTFYIKESFTFQILDDSLIVKYAE
ncbi:family 1 encapsulin nanocompartment shell protein [Konateibacter massiliensis]|uniref:family 1 encapsulin nanocompartment shell protein n=1 Tax=Konateibacter massiliensis TaxID=2002841 RepID=UPI000C160DA3|nr:family 1 encapsulin nanocompartment shell protein [Konateibacter massiliensis]